MTKKPKQNHTPGQWRAVYFSKHNSWDVDAPRFDERFSILEDVQEADASLIAMAPEMIQMLENIQVYLAHLIQDQQLVGLESTIQASKVLFDLETLIEKTKSPPTTL